jgi:hypothetical protein
MAAVSPSPNFVPDRYGNPTGAIGVRDAYTYWSLSADVYATGDFSMTFWTKIYQFREWSRIIDCGNGVSSDNMIVCNAPTTLRISLSPGEVQFDSLATFPISSWVHYAVVMNGTTVSIYQNGTFINSHANLPVLANVVRTKCFLGKSNWGDSALNGDLDDFKLFNRAINAQEVFNDFLI